MAADRIAVLGAGSVGCFIGGAWAAAGLPVRLHRPPRIAHDIRDHGLTLTDYAGWRPAGVDYPCVPAVLAEAEIILVCVKSGATAEAVARHRRAWPGWGDGAQLSERRQQPRYPGGGLGGRFRISGMIPYNVAYLGDGLSTKASPANLTEDRPETRDLAKRIGDGPAALRLSSDMLGLAWGKLLINLNNAVSALSDGPSSKS